MTTIRVVVVAVVVVVMAVGPRGVRVGVVLNVHYITVV